METARRYPQGIKNYSPEWNLTEDTGPVGYPPYSISTRVRLPVRIGRVPYKSCGHNTVRWGRRSPNHGCNVCLRLRGNGGRGCIRCGYLSCKCELSR
jgi:hypothetical protein